MISLKARRVQPLIKYDDKDISADLKPYLKSLSYTDALSGEADDLQITLEDRKGLWQSDWMPEKGALLDASLTASAWENLFAVDESFVLGLFEIDEITSQGYPSEVQIKAVSVPDNNTLRGIEKTRSWEKTELKVIAQDIADGAKMKLVYSAAENPVLDRAEQTEQSDLSFLYALCNEKGLALKICDNQIVIFDEEEYEQADAKITIVKPGTVYTPDENEEMTYITRILSYKFTSKVRDVYAACHVKYSKGENKETIEATFTVPDKKGKTLQVNEQVENQADAEKIAKKKLREKNKDEITGSFSLPGSFALAASVVLNVLGFGVFDGKYIITNARHDVGSGYTTSIDIRRCLNGY